MWTVRDFWPWSRLVLPMCAVGLLAAGNLQAQPGVRGPGSVSAAAEEPCEPLCGGVSVTRDGEQLGTHVANTSGHTAVFTVRNTGPESDTYALRCEAQGPVVCEGLGDRSVRLDADETVGVQVAYSVGAAGTGSLRLVAASEETVAEDEGSYAVTIQDPSIAVTPDGQDVNVLPWQWATQVFRLEHLGSGTVSYDLSLDCSGAAYACSASAQQLTFRGRETKELEVRFFMYGMGGGGVIHVAAIPVTYTWLLGDVGSVHVSRGQAEAPEVDVASVNAGETVVRDLCLAASAGASAAYECGDLRVVHALPTTRTLNKERTPTLLYNSGQAHPYPRVAANVTLGATTARPDRVLATLKVEGVERASGEWSGDVWGKGETKRIVLGYDALSDETGIDEYTLEVESVYGSRSESRVVTGQVAVVNRSESPFGAGWWLAGLERLYPGPRSESFLWVGGDGSVRVYDRVQRGVWAAPEIDRPDTLKLDGIAEEVVRYLPHGVQVRFDPSTGQHVSTVNRLGHVTRFEYDRAGRLQAIVVPTPAAGLAYSFDYDTRGDLLGVAAPSGSEQRDVLASVVDGNLVSLRDPDGSVVRFEYDPGSRMRVRWDRNGNATHYAFGGAGTLASTRLAMGPGEDPIVMRFEAAAARRFSGGATSEPLDLDELYTRIDGSRTDVQDASRFWLDRFGAPTRIEDALGHETQLIRGDGRWPGLVTRVHYPNGRVVSARYDDRGNIVSRTDSSTYRTGKISRGVSGPAESGVERVENALYELFAYPSDALDNPKKVQGIAGSRVYATTRYEWDRKWDFVTKIVPPEGDSTVIAYDPATGNRLWQQDARGAMSRVEFGYNSLGLLERVEPPLSPARHVRYDALGNLFEIDSPSGHLSTYLKDAVGRDTLVVTPIDTLGEHQVTHRTVYDAAGRPVRESTVAPGRVGLQGVEPGIDSLIVGREFDAAGNLRSITRRVAPDLNSLGEMTTRYRYDAAHRKVVEIAPDGAVDSFVYDPAGNVTEHHTRRGHVITMEYDALHRRVRRVVPEVYYPEWQPQNAGQPIVEEWSLPKYTDGLTIPEDVATFSYDAMGNLLTADNSYARISRTYDARGALLTDTLRIRTYTGDDFSQHVYGLRYGYDLNGRRLWIEHPSGIAPRVNGELRDRAEYTYGAAGRLATVTDVLGNVFSYEYDADGRLQETTFPGGITETREYNDEGLMDRRVLEAARWGPEEELFDDPIVHDDTLFYDARGKIVEARTVQGRFYNAYSGMGSIIRWSASRPIDLAEEGFFVDALGNHSTHWTTPPPGEGITIWTELEYESGTGRLQRTGPIEELMGDLGTQDWYAFTYDEAGNQERMGHTRFPFQGGSYEYVHTAARYYDADQVLRVVDNRACTLDSADQCFYPLDMLFGLRSVFEEYRYDALGRRILVRSRYDESCENIWCPSSIQRTVWDGQQVLYEMRYRGGDDVSESELERDRGPVYHRWNPYGRIAYTHAAGIDRPVDVIRMEYSADWPEPQVVVPHTNWRQSFDVGSFTDGSARRCKSFEPAPIDEMPCVFVEWPAHHQRVFHSLIEPALPPRSWFGSLLGQQRDASGQLYKRNRYYDPVSGRFTQEDPIGLAGGLNLYGYAYGDPVNYSDPFGLFPPSTFPNLPALFGWLSAQEDAETNVSLDVTTPLGSVDMLSGEESLGLTSTLIGGGVTITTGTPIEGDAVTLGGLSAKVGLFDLSASYTFGTDGGCQMNICFGASVGVPYVSFSYASDDFWNATPGPNRDRTIAPADNTSTVIYLKTANNLPLIQPAVIGRTR